MKAIAKHNTGGLYLVNIGAGEVVAVQLTAKTWDKVPNSEKVIERPGWTRVDMAENDLIAPQIRSILDDQAARRPLNLAPAARSLSMSYDTKRSIVEGALKSKFGIPNTGYPSIGGSEFWVCDMNDESVIYKTGGRTFSRGYTFEPDGEVDFDDMSTEVVPGWTPLKGDENYLSEKELSALKST